MTCPSVPEIGLPVGGFMDQEQFECPNGLYGKIFYTCISGTWYLKEECRRLHLLLSNFRRLQI